MEKIIKEALSKGMIDSSSKPTRIELVELIFKPDFSTADTVTAISGRGVRMDAVRTYIEERGGTFEVEIDDPYGYEIKTTPAPFVIRLPDKYVQKMDQRVQPLATAV